MEPPSENISGSDKSSINYKIVAIICGLSVAFGFYIYFITPNDNEFNFNYLIWILSPLSCGIGSLIIAKRYWPSEKVFGKAYLALGLSYLSYTIGVAIWTYQEISGDVPYPGPADLFYILYAPLATIHLVLNIQKFKKDISIKSKISVAVIAAIITASFLILAFTYPPEETVPELSDPGFQVSTTYVVTTAIVFSLALLGLTIFHKSTIRHPWRLLVAGIFMFTVAEVWYDYAVMYGIYTTSDASNALYILSFMIVTYALYLHRKAI